MKLTVNNHISTKLEMKKAKRFIKKGIMFSLLLPSYFYRKFFLAEEISGNVKEQMLFILNNPENKTQSSPRVLNALEKSVFLIQKKSCSYYLRALYKRIRFKEPLLSSFFANTTIKSVGKSILIIDYQLPRYDEAAGDLATYGIIKTFSELGYSVTFIPGDLTKIQKYDEALTKLGVTVFYGNGARGLSQAVKQISSQFDLFYIFRCDIYTQCLSAIRNNNPRAYIIFHAPDCYSLREKREMELNGLKDQNLKDRFLKHSNQEREAILDSDLTLVVSSVEKDLLKNKFGVSNIETFPALFIQISPREKILPFEQRKNIFFIGGFGHRPNQDAMIWFLNAIWPLIREKDPTIEFHIFGSSLSKQLKESFEKFPGVKVKGFVEQLEILRTYRLSVAPLRYGAGIKGKVATSLAMGIPVVGTTIAMEGMDIVNNTHSSICDDPRSFADAVIKFYSDKKSQTRLSDEGRSHVNRMFSEGANAYQLLSILNRKQLLDCDSLIQFIKRAPTPEFPITKSKLKLSVVVPVYNQWSFTENCLKNILLDLLLCNIPSEVIVADDASGDETKELNRRFPTVIHVRNKTNQGFLRNCNNAVANAKAPYVVLLNNDTLLFPGFFKNLLAGLEGESRIGAVGAKVMYPDGKIQEAGNSLLRNGAGSPHGRGRERYDLRFSFPAVVDYCSGCALVFRKSDWEKVGGFDTIYENAYCEDSDFCLKLKSINKDVLFNPSAEIIHFEHGSYLDSVGSKKNIKKFQEENSKKLTLKWDSFFKSCPLPDYSNKLILASNLLKQNPKLDERSVLFYSPFSSHPQNHGNKRTIYNFCSFLKSAGYKVHFVTLSNYLDFSYLKEMRKAWDTVDILTAAVPMTVNNATTFDAWYDPKVGEELASLSFKYGTKHVLCSYIFQSKFLELLPDCFNKIIDTHDQMSSRFEKLKSKGLPLEFFSCSPQQEGRYLRRADVVISRTAKEALVFNEEMGQEKAVVVPHLEVPKEMNKKFDNLSRIGIVASSNIVNLYAVTDFLRQFIGIGLDKSLEVIIAGEVRNLIPRLSPEEQEFCKNPSVKFIGFVKDIKDFYMEVDCVVSPITFGTGINVKTVEALSYGVPIFSTKNGMKGVGSSLREHSFDSIEDLCGCLKEYRLNKKSLSNLSEKSIDCYREYFHTNLNNFLRIFDCKY